MADITPWVAPGVVFLILLVVPGWVAKARGHPNTTAIRVCALCGLLFPPLVLVALIWSCMSFKGGQIPYDPHRAEPGQVNGAQWPRDYSGSKNLSFPETTSRR